MTIVIKSFQKARVHYWELSHLTIPFKYPDNTLALWVYRIFSHLFITHTSPFFFPLPAYTVHCWMLVIFFWTSVVHVVLASSDPKPHKRTKDDWLIRFICYIAWSWGSPIPVLLKQFFGCFFERSLYKWFPYVSYWSIAWYGSVPIILLPLGPICGVDDLCLEHSLVIHFLSVSTLISSGQCQRSHDVTFGFVKALSAA